MTSAKPIAVIALLGLAGTAVAQEELDDRRIAELIQQLQIGEDEDAALHALLSVAPRLKDRIQSEIERGRVSRALLRLLEEMGPDGVDSIPWLLAAVEACPPELQPAVFHAIHTLVSYLPHAHIVPTNVQVRRVHQRCVAGAGTDDLYQQLRDVGHYGAQRAIWLSGTQRVGSESSVLELQAVLEEQNHLHLQHEMVAELLGRRGEAARSALPVLLARMREQVHSHHSGISSGGDSWGVDWSLGTHRKFAEAILRIDPGAPEAAAAHGYLVRHGDSFQSRRSMEFLRGFGEGAGEATRDLARVAKDPDVDTQFRQDVITTLGILGSAAREAIPTLEELSAHEDTQVAERAKVALRQIRG